jgi:uncharacterized protein with PQ loop repeat
MEIIGWIGTTLVVIAYYPQIHHLFVEKCAWGISITTWMIWLISAGLLLVYALLRFDELFIIVQIINILSIAATIALVRRSNNICPYHLSTIQKYVKGSQWRHKLGTEISNPSDEN